MMPKRKAGDVDERRLCASGNESKSAGKKEKDASVVDRINAMSPRMFRSTFVKVEDLSLRTSKPGDDDEYTLDLKTSATLSPEELNACYDLIEHSSRADYEASSWGWHPQRKRREMREPEMRYLLVRHSSNTTAGDSTWSGIEGFLSFMITHDSSPPVPVLYVYEIHLAESLRGAGLGGNLMRLAEDIANRIGVEKVMLTCFLRNERARGFYRRRGYARDVCSPEDRRTRNKIVKVDYEIMSKDLWEEEEEKEEEDAEAEEDDHTAS